ncbi:epoxide hydrolase 1 [Mycena vitilis]|nr:epoxide hydrolase 1 [Mycena vitilis]
MNILLIACIVVVTASTAAAGVTSDSFDVKPFEIHLTARIARLKSLVENTHLPDKALYPDVSGEHGIELDVLRELRSNWLTSFDWEAQQAELNQFKQFTAVIEGLTVHFVHEKSADPEAIPVILLHGWPGSFHEFSPVIKPLTQSSALNGKNASFNVVVPSLPGFVFSSAPPANWTVDDSARVFNVLMTEVLGYSTYAVHSTDWTSFNTTVRAAQFVFVPFFPPSAQDIIQNNITLSPIQEVTEQRLTAWTASGSGYFIEQTGKPYDIGLALYDNPVGQLAWIGAKFKLYSDPRAGTSPSVLNNTAILTSVSLYYLTESFLSSVWIYEQNHDGIRSAYPNSTVTTDAPLLFSQYKYNVGLWPKEYVAKVGNLVSYKAAETDERVVHDFGGHFAGLDNPPALIADIREIGLYFKPKRWIGR